MWSANRQKMNWWRFFCSIIGRRGQTVSANERSVVIQDLKVYISVFWICQPKQNYKNHQTFVTIFRLPLFRYTLIHPWEAMHPGVTCLPSLRRSHDDALCEQSKRLLHREAVGCGWHRAEGGYMRINASPAAVVNLHIHEELVICRCATFQCRPAARRRRDKAWKWLTDRLPLDLDWCVYLTCYLLAGCLVARWCNTHTHGLWLTQTPVSTPHGWMTPQSTRDSIKSTHYFSLKKCFLINILRK